ncbi:MAG: hypothetical protein M3Q80_00155 [bacterium]|nr:hypothetical protein [bacterium]
MHLTFKNHKKVYTNRQRDSVTHHFFDNPYLDWVVIICTSILLAGLCIVVGVHTYSGIQKRLQAPAAAVASNAITSFDTEALSRVLKQIEYRSEVRSKLLKGYAGPSDPARSEGSIATSSSQ